MGVTTHIETELGAAPESDRGDRIDGIVIGLVVRGGADGVLVDWDGNQAGEVRAAVATVAVGDGDAGRRVALAFEEGDPSRPIVMGFIYEPGVADIVEVDQADDSVAIERDGDRLTLRADREIVLKCGKSSITLTRAGKVLIRGAYLLSRSSGVNRIKGGSVQIN